MDGIEGVIRSAASFEALLDKHGYLRKRGLAEVAALEMGGFSNSGPVSSSIINIR